MRKRKTTLVSKRGKETNKHHLPGTIPYCVDHRRSFANPRHNQNPTGRKEKELESEPRNRDGQSCLPVFAVDRGVDVHHQVGDLRQFMARKTI